MIDILSILTIAPPFTLGEVVPPSGDPEAAGAFRRCPGPRIWRGDCDMNNIKADTLEKTAREEVYLVFDFSAFPEVRDGWTLSSPEIHADDGIEHDPPAVTTDDWDDVDAGEGVIAKFSGGEAGYDPYDVSCTATISSGPLSVVREVPGKLLILDTGT